MVKDIRLQRCDLSRARIREAWIERGLFEDVRFDGADLSGLADHSNTFRGCSFLRTKFHEAVIGYQGSAYKECLFDQAGFSRSGFIRAEFDDCQFRHCRLKGVDFNASSFVRCSFVGVLKDVWFRGGFPLPSDAKEFGNRRRNEMKHVSFEDAELHDITFSNYCDLSTIVLPSEGEYRLYSGWKNRLERLQHVLEGWSPGDRKEAEVFVYSYMVHAKSQDWYLLNCEDLRNKYGRALGDRIHSALQLSN